MVVVIPNLYKNLNYMFKVLRGLVSSMTSEKTGVPLLKGLSNYMIWAIKIKSFLIREGLDKTLD